MAHDTTFSAPAGTDLPTVRTITPQDLKHALARGIDDFQAMPSHAIFLTLIYPVIGILLGRLIFGYELLPLLFPLAAGFALIGPIAAIGLYELSRRREQGLDASWEHAFDVFRAPSFGAIAILGALLMVVLLVWLAIAHGIYIAAFGYGQPSSIGQFLHDVFMTRQGWMLIVVGNLVGFLFALMVLVVSVVSFPLLLDRNIGAAAAVVTSVRAVAANPGTMALWGLIVAALLVIGSIPLFFGLAVVVPVLGHATWHLYRRVVA